MYHEYSINIDPHIEFKGLIPFHAQNTESDENLLIYVCFYSKKKMLCKYFFTYFSYLSQFDIELCFFSQKNFCSRSVVIFGDTELRKANMGVPPKKVSKSWVEYFLKVKYISVTFEHPFESIWQFDKL